MRFIEYEKIVGTVEQLCIAAAHELPGDVLEAMKKAAQNESNPKAKKVIETLIENADIAKSQKIPLCQDTGRCIGIEVGHFFTAQNKRIPLESRLAIHAFKERLAAGFVRPVEVRPEIGEFLEDGVRDMLKWVCYFTKLSWSERR